MRNEQDQRRSTGIHVGSASLCDICSALPDGVFQFVF